ncbi:hypothetical protein CJD36_004525 [Flavipsychrobacter stenotrophus]|uniref:Uncharacterized protein n=1 Tax=Flavipsychrobacter stenotrophus TaxID=2077091 RepID=A0A2S7T227_9BACT|nr:hypothetical protein [Flavipsychrobacter stenotrophus]PQJ13014.1 hypothetical protein CJD36_004525 [Flavipsychrobacter stenotrophus]
MTKYIWGFSWLRAAQTKKQDTAIKIRTQAEILRSECLLQASIETQARHARIMRLLYKCGIKTIQNSRARIHSDYLDQRTINPNPVLTENQIAELKKYPLSLLLIAIFGIGEGAMIWLITPILMPGAEEWLNLVTAAVLALLGMCCINYGLTWHFKHKDIRSKIPAAPTSMVSKYRDRANIGYFLITLTFAGLVASGFGRVYFLENIPADGLTAERIESLRMAGKFTSVFTMMVTISTALLMGVMKQESGDLGITFSVYRAWHVSNVRANKYYRRLLKEAGSLHSNLSQLIEKYWQLNLRLYELFKSDTGYDPKYEQLEGEYTALKSSAGFLVDNSVYLKFSPIQSAHEELYKYGFYNNNEINAKLSLANEAMEHAKKHLAEHAPDLSPSVKESIVRKDPIVTKPRNGRAKTKVVTALAVMSLFLASCADKTPPNINNVIALTDLSASRDSTVTGWYGEAIARDIISNLGSKDRIKVLPVDYASTTYEQDIYSRDFSNDKYLNEYAGLQSTTIAVKLHKDSANKAAQSFLQSYRQSIAARRKFSNGSDITGALQQAVRYRDEHAGNVIVIFSDMLQQTDSRHVDLEKAAVTTAYASLLSRMDTCDLRGMKIIVITGNQGNIPAEKFTYIKGLWALYFKKCGGTLLEYTSGSSATLQKTIAGK